MDDKQWNRLMIAAGIVAAWWALIILALVPVLIVSAIYRQIFGF